MEGQNEIFTEIKNLSYNELIDLRNQKIEQYKNKLEEAINTDESAKHGEDGSLKGYLWWESKMINRNLQFIDSRLLHKGKKNFNESLKATLEKEIDLLKESIKSMEEAEKKVNQLKPMYRNSQIQSANAKKEKIAQILKTDINNLCIKELPEDKAIYYYSKQRGGASLIMDDKNKYLAANSSVNFDNLYQEFKNGKRNGDFEAKTENAEKSEKKFSEKELVLLYNVIDEIADNQENPSLKEKYKEYFKHECTKGNIYIVVDALKRLNKHQDIMNEFLECLEQRTFKKDGLKVEGYSAVDISNKLNFNVLGSYDLLARLIEEKEVAKNIIETNIIELKRKATNILLKAKQGKQREEDLEKFKNDRKKSNRLFSYRLFSLLPNKKKHIQIGIIDNLAIVDDGTNTYLYDAESIKKVNEIINQNSNRIKDYSEKILNDKIGVAKASIKDEIRFEEGNNSYFIPHLVDDKDIKKFYERLVEDINVELYIYNSKIWTYLSQFELNNNFQGNSDKANTTNNDNKNVEYKSFTEKEFLQIYNVIEEITANDKDSSIKEMLLNEYLRKDTKTGYGSGTGDVKLVIEAFRTINKYEDVKQDFIKCLSKGKFLDDGLEIDGYTAKSIEEKTDFNPLGSYYLLAKLKSDDKDEIKYLIEKGYDKALLHTQTFYPMVKYIEIFDIEKRKI